MAKYTDLGSIITDGPFFGKSLLTLYLETEYGYLLDLIDSGEWAPVGDTKHVIEQAHLRQLTALSLVEEESDYIDNYY